jgi:hypothetical protein
MTSKAREVLGDCEKALQDLSIHGLQGRAWRLRWVTAVVLLRTVGYVLKKVDEVSSPYMKEAIDEAWKECKRTKPQIFHCFIEEDRNLILKEYTIRAGQGVTIHVGSHTEWSYTIRGGPFDGRDQREVVEEAIAWWKQYLDRVDDRASRLAACGKTG